MRILVLGGYGLIGSAIVRRLTAGGHEVVGLGRHVEAARRAMPDADWIAADLASMTRGDDWLGVLRLARATAIVNAAGVLQDGARDNVERVQSRAMQALYGVARSEGVAAVVQISATRAIATSRCCTTRKSPSGISPAGRWARST